MFEKLVESKPAGAVRSRKNYFVVTTLAMSVLSLTAVVVSIFADDYSLNAGIDLAELISPDEMAQVAPEQPQPRQQMPRTQQTISLPTRTIAQASVDDIRAVPDSVSTTPNTHLSIPGGRFQIGPNDLNPRTSGGDPGPDSGRGSAGDQTGINAAATRVVTPTEEGTPPRVTKPAPVKSGGVLNGKAVNLPVPAYPAPAIAVHAEGQVTVQVTLDETGKVISATAVSGHPLLRAAAVDAARRARFTPTYLTGVPVKVTGVIVYNFNRG